VLRDYLVRRSISEAIALMMPMMKPAGVSLHFWSLGQF
jgi:hypothetical protein